MPNDPVERAKADRVDLQRQINALETEMQRITQMRATQVQQRDRLTAFIDLYARYAEPPQEELALSSDKSPAGEQLAPDPHKALHPRGMSGSKLKRRRKSGVVAKPKGIPSMPAMIKMALLEARTLGKDGLEPKAMREHIATQWWPGVKASQIAPIAWRMFDRHELEKKGDVYRLPHADEAPGEPTPSASTEVNGRSAGDLHMPQPTPATTEA